MRRVVLLLVLVVFVAVGCKKKKKAPALGKGQGVGALGERSGMSGADVSRRLAQFAPVPVKVDRAKLTANEIQALRHLRRAADEINRIFWKQVWSKASLVRSKVRKEGGPAAALYEIHYGPWDRLDHFTPFYGSYVRPKGGGFYPEDLTQKALEAYIKKNPGQKEELQSPYTVVRRNGGKLEAVPYSKAYAAELTVAARALEQAAGLVKSPSLARFLRSRAKSFLSNDYFQSDIDWMDVQDNKIDVTIGPYEVYEDKLMGFKAAFEAIIGLRDEAASKALALYRKHLPALDKALPMPARYRFKRGSSSPIVVVNKIYAGGDGKVGVQAIAFNLPNDERVRAKKGSKKVMLKNITQAKFQKILRPIAARLLEKKYLKDIDFETFFNQALMHELAHGMGPGILERPGGNLSVNKALKELYPAIEEAKADMVGLYSSGVLLRRGLLPKSRERFVFPTYLAGILRSVRFGAEAAHGKANVLQLNFLAEHGALHQDPTTGIFSLTAARMPAAVKKLSSVLLAIEGEGDYARAKAFIAKYGNPSPALKKALARLKGIPVDVVPSYPRL